MVGGAVVEHRVAVADVGEVALARERVAAYLPQRPRSDMQARRCEPSATAVKLAQYTAVVSWQASSAFASARRRSQVSRSWVQSPLKQRNTAWVCLAAGAPGGGGAAGSLQRTIADSIEVPSGTVTTPGWRWRNLVSSPSLLDRSSVS